MMIPDLAPGEVRILVAVALGIAFAGGLVLGLAIG